jgi:8-amino-7-oxononanoate synthase
VTLSSWGSSDCTLQRVTWSRSLRRPHGPAAALAAYSRLYANMSAGPPSENAVLRAELDQLSRDGLFRSRSPVDSPQGARVWSNGREWISFASNDYLGLASDPRVIEAAREGAARHGVGAGASHLLYGHGQAHDELEQALAAFVGYPQALLFSTGYMANIGTITALCGRDDEIFADKLNHASLNDAMVLSHARFRRYPHLDLGGLQRALAASRARRKLIVTDAVFSMDGDLAPVPELVALCEQHDAWLMLDDAHGFGVLGEHGAGILSHYKVESQRVIYMGTLGKAAGVFGAFVAAHPPLIDFLVNRARTYIYTTATPPLLAAALLESLRILRSEDWRRKRLAELIRILSENIAPGRGTLLPSSTAIQPLIIGAAADATRAARGLAERGLLVPAVRPPTVPKGSARLRISLSAAHGPDDVWALLEALREL